MTGCDSTDLPAGAKRFIEMLGLQYPIIQAPMDGPAKSALAAAVSNAGALGSLPLTWRTPEEAYEQVVAVRAAAPDRPFFANYVLNFEPTSLDRAIEAGIQMVQFSWGLPDAGLLSKLRDHGIKLGLQVSGEGNAIDAMKLEPDFLICQGTEAGGHVQAYQSLATALREVLSVAGDVPVAASGGISTGHDIRRWLTAGASAVVLGTRFVATEESVAYADYKQALLAGSAEDTVFTVCLNNAWPNATHRILKNSSFDMWESAGCPPAGQRPQEHEIIAVDAQGTEYARYDNVTPIEGMTGADVMGLGVYAGLGVTEIRDIPSAGDLVRRLWHEYEAVDPVKTTREGEDR